MMRGHPLVAVALASTIVAATAVAHQGTPPRPQQKPIVVEHISPAHAAPGSTQPLMSQGQKETVISPVVHFPPLPDSIPELVASVDLVVLGRMIKGSAPRAEIDSQEQVTVRRAQVIEVLEILKGNGQAARARRVTIFQGGGTVNVGSRTVVERPVVRILEPGETAILFLRVRQDLPDTHHIAYGPAGLLMVSEERTVALPPGMQAMPEMLNRKVVPLDDLLALLRSAAGA